MICWQSMDNAPKDREILVVTNIVDVLPRIAVFCQWHPDAGFWVDELREAVLWTEAP